jgi:hypothetical protein
MNEEKRAFIKMKWKRAGSGSAWGVGKSSAFL